MADKEETGSDGNTGLNSEYLYDFIRTLSSKAGADPIEVFEKSACLSADVNAAFDPDYAEVYEKNNASLVNCGAEHPGNYVQLKYILEVFHELQICGVEELEGGLYRFNVYFNATNTNIEKSYILKKLRSQCKQ